MISDPTSNPSTSNPPALSPPLPPPFISVPNVHNFRALGPHVLPRGQRTRSNLVYRSAEPSAITPEGIATLQELGIRVIYDLRSKTDSAHQEVAKFESLPGFEHVVVPVFGHVQLSPMEINEMVMRDYGDPNGSEGYARAYAGILDAGSKHGAYRRIFEHLRDRPSDPFLVHCSAGKDRTGIICALMLNLAGVGDDEVADEYALTTQGLGAWLPRVVEKMMAAPTFNKDEDLIRRALSSKREHMLSFLQHLREQWGSVAGYLEDGLGFEPEEVVRIRESLVEQAPDGADRL